MTAYQIQTIHCTISQGLYLPCESVSIATKKPAKHQTASSMSLPNCASIDRRERIRRLSDRVTKANLAGKYLSEEHGMELDLAHLGKRIVPAHART